MTAALNIGFIGAGGNTRRKHIPGFQKQEGVYLAGVVNRSRASSERVAAEFGIPKVYEHWEELVDDPEIDAVCIGTWPYMHAPATIRALEAGKHVLCEARMAMNATEARRMLAASLARPELAAQIVPSPHMLGPDAAIHECLRDRRLGDVVAVDVSMRSRQFADFESPMSWRQDRELSGMNTMGMGIVYEAAMRWLGPARTVCSALRITVPERPGADGRLHPVRIPDHVEVVGELEIGAAYHLQCSAVTGMGPENAAWIYGTEGTLKVDFPAKKVWLGVRGSEEMEDVTPPEDTWAGWRVEEEFVGAIRGEERVKLTPFEDGVRYMEFTEAVARSHERGERMEIGSASTL